MCVRSRGQGARMTGSAVGHLPARHAAQARTQLLRRQRQQQGQQHLAGRVQRPSPAAVGGLGRARGRGSAGGGGGGSRSMESSGASAATCVWSPDRLAQLAEGVSGWQGGEPVVRALRVLERCGRERVRGGRTEGVSAEYKAVMSEALGALFGIGVERVLGPVVVQVPMLCQLRALARTCNNTRCGVLPPAGRTEAEAGEGKGIRVGSGAGGCSGAWYCCVQCREQHRGTAGV